MIPKIFAVGLFSILLLASCYQEDTFEPSDFDDLMTLLVENDGEIANGKNVINVIAKFNEPLNTETDNKVEFTVYKENSVTLTRDIRKIVQGNIIENIAEMHVSSLRAGDVIVEAKITIRNIDILKSRTIKFKSALCESINVQSSSLKIAPDSSFNEITITTEIRRSEGTVSLGTEAKTIVVDSDGASKGILTNYQNRTDSLGNITNRFTMGNDSYEGKLFVISNSECENNQENIDTLIIYSQK